MVEDIVITVICIVAVVLLQAGTLDLFSERGCCKGLGGGGGGGAWTALPVEH